MGCALGQGSLVSVSTRQVFDVADCFLRLAFGAAGHALCLLLAIAGHRADLRARFSGDVLHVALCLISVHLASPIEDDSVRNGPSILRARSAFRPRPALRPREAAAR